jgi:hypothetical protein
MFFAACRVLELLHHLMETLRHARPGLAIEVRDCLARQDCASLVGPQANDTSGTMP